MYLFDTISNNEIKLKNILHKTRAKKFWSSRILKMFQKKKKKKKKFNFAQVLNRV